MANGYSSAEIQCTVSTWAELTRKSKPVVRLVAMSAPSRRQAAASAKLARACTRTVSRWNAAGSLPRSA